MSKNNGVKIGEKYDRTKNVFVLIIIILIILIMGKGLSGAQKRKKRKEGEKALAEHIENLERLKLCLLYTSPSPRDRQKSRMPSSA